MIYEQEVVTAEELRWADYTLRLHESISPIAEAWDGFLAPDDVFLRSPYLRAMEEAPPRGMQFFYVLVMRKGRITGLLYLQLHFFNAADSLNYDRSDEKPGVRQKIRDFVAEKIQFYTLICGNATITGPYGFRFEENIDGPEQMAVLDCTLEWVKDILDKRGREVKLMFVKDFFDPLFTDSSGTCFFEQYHEFKAQPGMFLQIREEWKSYSDYLKALQSKYRVRAKRARRLLGKVERRELNATQIEDICESIFKQYKHIADKAVFNLFILEPGYFLAMKRRLGSKFHLFGCFLDEELVGFYSVVEEGEELVAHFLGYEEKFNHEHQLYLNMLFDIIEFAIDNGFRSISFARTALEIKSSVGATPENLMFYLRYTGGIHNRLLPFYYNLLEPEEKWTPRQPFKLVGGG